MTVRIDALPENLEGKLLDVELKEHKEKRSKDANALLWACIGEIAKSKEILKEPWDVYLSMLRKYGKYTYIVVKPDAVDAVKKQWRECEVIGDIDIHGTKGVQMLCFYGSSTYTTSEMSTLIDGVLSDMADLGLQRPASGDIRRALEEWRKHHE